MHDVERDAGAAPGRDRVWIAYGHAPRALPARFWADPGGIGNLEGRDGKGTGRSNRFLCLSLCLSERRRDLRESVRGSVEARGIRGMRDDANWLRAAGGRSLPTEAVAGQFRRRQRLVPGKTDGRVRLDGLAAGCFQVGQKVNLGPETDG